MNRIRDIYASCNGAFFVACENEKRVHIFKSTDLSWVSSFDTIFDFGGNRVAVSDSGEFVLSAAYHIYGVILYNIKGNVLWQRKDLKKAQNVKFSYNQKYCIVSTDSNTYWLDIATGSNVNKTIYIDYWEHPKGDVNFSFSGRYKYRLMNNGKPINNFIESNILSVCFSDDLVFMSEMGGGLIAYNIYQNSIYWRNCFANGTHYIKLACFDKFLVGHLFAYDGESRNAFIDSVDFIDTSSGQIANRIILGSEHRYGIDFISADTHFVSSDGRVFSLQNREIFHKIDFSHLG